jgi:serine/threonine-protein kinase TTK/MPS1
MSPETIENPDGVSRRLKVGRPSDIWSLGCILYQMIYGHPPFHHLNGIVQKMKAIPDNNTPINFPASVVSAAPLDPSLPQDVTPDGRVSVPEAIINTMKRCLVRSPKDRATIPELLADNWLTMRDCE